LWVTVEPSIKVEPTGDDEHPYRTRVARRRRVAVACAAALAVLSTASACDRARDDSAPTAGGLTSPTKAPTASATATLPVVMYTHTISVFDPGGKLIKTIPDSVDLTDFGIKGHPSTSRGAPVEAAFTAAARSWSRRSVTAVQLEQG
jgi:hypothetical protein